MTTKLQIRKAYIRNLQAAYPLYGEGSPGLDRITEALDHAFMGLVKLDGKVWLQTLKECGLSKGCNTRKYLAALPES
jgi:hypothetical protein